MADSIQNKLMRMKPPRVKMTYEIETDGRAENRELPFVVGILADLKGDRDRQGSDDPLATRPMRDIDRDNFNDVMRSIAPRIVFSPSEIAQWAGEHAHDGDQALAFRSISDFEPRQVIAAMPSLARLDEHDPALKQSLAAVMHSDGFRKMEASWRGLHYLVFNTATTPMLRLRLLDIGKDELRQDLTPATATGHSALFRKISHEDAPCSVLIGDHEISGGNDMVLLHAIAQMAATLHTAFIAPAAPGLLGLTSFSGLTQEICSETCNDTDALRDWCAFRESDAARWVTLTLPRARMRLPYELPCALPGTASGLWGNSAMLLAACITRTVALYAWPAAIQGLEGGGQIERLPGDMPAASLTDALVDIGLEKELNSLGFATLRQDRGAACFSVPPMLPHLLAASRYAHYLPAVMRARAGNTWTRGQVQDHLDGWLANHVLLDENAAQEEKSRHPLSAASVFVSEAPGEPDVWLATLWLQPQFQLQALTTSIRLPVRLPK